VRWWHETVDGAKKCGGKNRASNTDRRSTLSVEEAEERKMNTHTALRDRFAAAALPGVFAVAVELARVKSEALADPASIAEYACEVADALPGVAAQRLRGGCRA
jgi:hypothetical protein